MTDRQSSPDESLSESELAEFRNWKATRNQLSAPPESESAPSHSEEDLLPSSSLSSEDSSPDAVVYVRTSRTKLARRVALVGGGLFLVSSAAVIALVVADSSPDFSAIQEQCENSMNFHDAYTMALAFDPEAAEADKTLYSDPNEMAERRRAYVPTAISISPDGSSMQVGMTSTESVNYEAARKAAASQEIIEKAQSLDRAMESARDIMVLGVVNCVHGELGFPDSIQDAMTATRALDGTQERTSNGTRVQWTYHPSDGVQAIYERP